MVDVKHRKLFLKKSPCPPEISIEDFYIGSQIVLMSRDLKIVDYGDIQTKNKLSRVMEETILILSSSYSSNLAWGNVIHFLTNNLGYSLTKLKSVLMTGNILNSIQKIATLQNLPGDNNEHVLDEPYLVLKIQKENAINDLYNDVFNLAEAIRPNQCLMYTINNKADYAVVEQLFFDPKLSPMPSATYDNCTCCIIKPHVVKSKQVGLLLNDILQEGYEVSAIHSVYFSKSQAEEFLEVYKGEHVLPIDKLYIFTVNILLFFQINLYRRNFRILGSCVAINSWFINCFRNSCTKCCKNVS